MDNSALHLRVVLRESDLEIVELHLRGAQLILQLHLALEELADLALNLARFLDHHLPQQLLTQLGDRHDRTRTLATLVGGGLVRTVVARVLHTTSIRYDPIRCKPLAQIFG